MTDVPLRVALVHSFYSDKSSGENVVVDAEAEALGRAGVDVHVVRTDGAAISGGSDRVLAAIRVALDMGRNPSREVAGQRADVIHVHNLFPSWTAGWMRRVRSPLVATLHNYRPVCANGLLLRNGSVCTDCFSRPALTSVRHGCYRGSRLATLPIALRQASRGLRDPHLTGPTCLLVPSQGAKETFAAAGVSRGRLTVEEPFLPEPIRAKPRASPNGFLYVGRVSRRRA